MIRPLATTLTAVLALSIQQSLAPYVPTPHDIVDRMLSLAAVTRSDVVYDLGCGDGRIPIAAAAKYGARGIGIDIDPRRIAEAKSNAKAAGVEHLVEFRLDDAMTAQVVAAFGPDALGWARSVELTGAAELSVVTAPLGDRWVVVGVGG